MKLYNTSDFKKATVLVTLGYPIIKVEKSGNGNFVIYFKLTDNLMEDITKYVNGQLVLCAKTLFDNQNHVRSLTKDFSSVDNEMVVSIY